MTAKHLTKSAQVEAHAYHPQTNPAGGTVTIDFPCFIFTAPGGCRLEEFSTNFGPDSESDLAAADLGSLASQFVRDLRRLDPRPFGVVIRPRFAEITLASRANLETVVAAVTPLADALVAKLAAR